MSSLTTANIVYLVPQDIYEKCQLEKQKEDEAFLKYPKRIVKKIKTILTFFASAGIRWSIVGCVAASPPEFTTSWNILALASYSVTGKGEEPSFLNSFLELAAQLEVPAELFANKFKKRVIKLQKQHAKAKK